MVILVPASRRHVEVASTELPGPSEGMTERTRGEVRLGLGSGSGRPQTKEGADAGGVATVPPPAGSLAVPAGDELQKRN